MQKVVIAICILGVESVAFGFASEATRIKAGDVKIINGKCVYPSSAAIGLGLSAALLLLIDQIIVSMYTGCINCKDPRPSGSYVTLPRICFALSWLTCLPAMIILLAGAAYQVGLGSSSGDTSCPVLAPGIFTAGTILDLLAFVMALVSYVATTSDYYRYNQHDTSTDPTRNAVPMTAL